MDSLPLGSTRRDLFAGGAAALFAGSGFYVRKSQINGRAPSGGSTASYIPTSTVTNKGDLIVGTGPSSVTALGVGGDGAILTADASQPTGVNWAAAAFVGLTGNQTIAGKKTFVDPIPIEIATGNPLATFRFRTQRGSFENGLYSDDTLAWGWNVDRADASGASSVLSLQVESMFRNSSSSPYGSEAHWDYTTPDGTKSNRPWGFFAEHVTANVHHSFAGLVNWTPSLSSATCMLLDADSASPALRFTNGTQAIFERKAGSTANLLVMLTETGAVLGSFTSVGGMSLGGPAVSGNEVLALTSSGDNTRIYFKDTTDNKTWYIGPLTTYTGDFVLDQSGIGNAIRVHHTTLSVGINYNPNDGFGGQLSVRPFSASVKGFVARVLTNQSAHIAEYQDVNGAPQFAVSKECLPKWAAAGAVGS